MEKRLLMLLVCAIATSAFAQNQGKQIDTTIPPVQPPPAMNDPGGTVALPTPQAEATTAITAAKADAPASASSAKAAEASTLPPDVQAAADAAELPVVTVRQDGSDTIEEYRKHGKLYFVRVLNDKGPAKYYVDDPAQVPATMQQLSGPSGQVQPVYYKLFDWK
jgi:uncharacterized protein DUF2782